VIAFPEMKFLFTASEIRKPSYTGTILVTPSPDEQIIPVVLPCE